MESHKQRKICVVTGTRAEYGLMFWLLKEIKNDKSLKLQIISTGMHLSPEFGMTNNKIIDDGFKVDDKVEILLSSDSPVGISKSMGLAFISLSESLKKLNPDILVVLGDRYEIFSAASVAMILNIPIAHIHGGEATEGLIDEPIRHSITKMSHIHLTSNDEYRKRVIQLGENPKSVFNTGTPGIDNLFKLKLLNKTELEESLSFKLGKLNFIVTFHPVTLENNTSKKQFEELLSALSFFKESKIIFTMPNSDTYGRVLIDMVSNYVKNNSNRSIAFKSLGQLKYLSTIKHIDVVIGNSSSGLIEVPSFKKPTINIGDRQKGRIKAKSVIDCLPKKNDIIKSIELALSEKFKNKIRNIKNPYGNKGASKRIKDILKNYKIDNILKKKFYNI